MSAVALHSFGYGDQLVRVIERDGTPWFVANDVCAVLEIKQPAHALKRLEVDERATHTVDTPGGSQQINIVSESGVYALVFKSRLPEAKRFRKWVTSEVLPAIRKVGKFEIPANDAGPQPTMRQSEIPVPFLGTADEREQIRVAVLMVRVCGDLYGKGAGRQMWQTLGFPVPSIDLETDQTESGGPREGDVGQFTAAAQIKPSTRDATHLTDLYRIYGDWCRAKNLRMADPTRFDRLMIGMFGTEEHPQMVRCIACKTRF
jgi:prophage antirepressor-like protein